MKKKVWKAVSNSYFDWRSACECRPGWECQYKLNRITRPREGSFLFAFDTVQQVLKFWGGFSGYTILECEADVAVRASQVPAVAPYTSEYFWEEYQAWLGSLPLAYLKVDWAERLNRPTSRWNECPWGTIFCRWIRPLQEVPYSKLVFEALQPDFNTVKD